MLENLSLVGKYVNCIGSLLLETEERENEQFLHKLSPSLIKILVGGGMESH